MSKKTTIILVALVLLLIGGGAAYYFTGDSGVDLNSPATAATAGADSIGANEHVMGNPNAPVTMIEYFAQACSVCAHFNETVFPQLKAKYIDTGKVRYVMRLFPLFPADAPSYKLDMCVPPGQFFQSADLLFRNQPEWDNAEFQVADPHAGLLKMAHIMGLSDAQAEACMNSTQYDATINRIAQDAMTRYQPDGTPTFVIEYKRVDMPQKSWEEVQAALDAALAAKGVH